MSPMSDVKFITLVTVGFFAAVVAGAMFLAVLGPVYMYAADKAICWLYDDRLCRPPGQ